MYGELVIINKPLQGDAGPQSEVAGSLITLKRVYFTIMTVSLHIIPLIAGLLTKEINNMTKY